MRNVRLEYCLDGFNLRVEKINSFESLKIRLEEIKNEASDIIKSIFSVDIIVENAGIISIGLNEKSILSYTSADFEETLTSLGDESALGKTLYYFGDYSLMSNKYIVPYSEALNVIDLWINEGILSTKIEWTEALY